MPKKGKKPTPKGGNYPKPGSKKRPRPKGGNYPR